MTEEKWGYKIGQTASLSRMVSEYDVYRIAQVSGDFNPIHFNGDYARRNTIFRDRIAHGLISIGLISAVLGSKFPGPGTIVLELKTKFTTPVFLGDAITALVEITEIREDRPILTLRIECKNQNGKTVLTGEAIVLVPKK